MNRKGSIQDILTIPAIVLFLVVSLFVVMKVFLEIEEPLQEAADRVMGAPSTETTTTLARVETSLSIGINAIPFISLLFGILSIVLAAQIPTHKGYMVFAFLFWVVGTIAAFLSSGILWEIMNIQEFLVITNQHTLLVGFVKYLGYITCFIGAMLLIAMYAKSNNEGGFSGSL